MIQEITCPDSFVSISNSTVLLRRLFQQHRPEADLDEGCQLAWLTGGSFCSPAVPPGLAKTNARRQLVRGGGPVVGCQEQAQ
jgi:hypothetical protein